MINLSGEGRLENGGWVEGGVIETFCLPSPKLLQTAMSMQKNLNSNFQLIEFKILNLEELVAKIY